MRVAPPDGVGRLASIFSDPKAGDRFRTSPNQKDLPLHEGAGRGQKGEAVIERRYALSEVPAALLHVGGGHTQGQTIIRIAAVLLAEEH